jgi:hypothetical protein
MAKGKSGQQGGRRSSGKSRKGQGSNPQQGGGDRGQRGQERPGSSR